MSDLSKQTGHEPLHPDHLTWAVLLGRWVEFARSAVGLPETGEGKRMRQSVADIIMLQAVYFALDHLEELDARQRAIGIDRAELLIDKHTQSLRERWEAVKMPGLLVELIEETRQQLEKVQNDVNGSR